MTEVAMQAFSRRLRAVPRRAGGSIPGTSRADLQRWCPPGVRAGRDLAQRLLWSAHPPLYGAQLGGRQPAGVRQTVGHYLTQGGAERGLRLCALFHPDWYAAALANRGLAAPVGPTPLFFHWLTVGWEQRIVPTPLFDEDWFAHRHPRLAADLERADRWPFEHYLREGCYQPEWVPSPLGRHHPGGDQARDPAGGAPLLLRELLHRADEFDLARTSWLEEGQRAGLRRLATLRSPRMRELIDAAVALDPAVRHSSATPFTTVPPYRTRRLFLAEQAEACRRELGRAHVDLVVLVSGSEQSRAGAWAGAEAHRPDGPAGGAVVIATDASPSAPAAAGGPAADVFDLARHAEGLEEKQRVDLLVDLLRGLTPRRVVVLDSRLGRTAASAFGRQLAALCALEIMVGDELVPHAVWALRGAQ